MRKSRFTEAQISGILQERAEAAKTAELIRSYGISRETFTTNVASRVGCRRGPASACARDAGDLQTVLRILPLAPAPRP